MQRLEIHESGEWAALYKNGLLVVDSVGDSYIAHDMALIMCGVQTVQDSPFLLGGTGRSDAARSVEQINQYVAERAERAQEAEALRQQAEQLLAEADALEAER